MLWTLSARLFLLIAVVTLAGLGLLAWFMIEIHTSHLEDEVIREGLRLSDTLRRSTRYSMLKNHKEAVYEIARTVGAQPGLDRIRIFNKEGRITFSTDEEEQGQTVDKQAEACTHCHTGAEPVSRLKSEELTRFFESSDGHRVLGLITPVYNESACSGAGCHLTPEQQNVLGVFDVQMSLERIDREIKEEDHKFLLLTYFLMLVIASTCGVFLWRFVHIPVKALIQGTEQVAKGNLDHRISIRSRTEIGRLSGAFNRMSAELARAHRQLTEWNRTLEQRVKEKAQSLQQAQARLVQSEKMASLGTLSAAVAHEINNPLSGVLTYTRLVKKIIGEDGPDPKRLPDIQKYLDTMVSEISRCGKIVGNLLEFSRQPSVVAGEANLNVILEKALALLEHKLELQEIHLVRKLTPHLPGVPCDPDQVQQALLAILINAVEAMPDGGELTVATRPVPAGTGQERSVEVEITDTGTGIPKDVQARLFEPFFSTKQDIKGVGLGLSVAYGIVRRHRGRIEVYSEEGRGATFVVSLPDRGSVGQESADRTVGRNGGKPPVT